jgi:hypothetical protein
MDDRKTKMLRDEREKEQRAARAAAALIQAEQQSEGAQTPSSDILVSSLSMSMRDDTDGPPPYEGEAE